jgi:hypothetical protein
MTTGYTEEHGGNLVLLRVPLCTLWFTNFFAHETVDFRSPSF